MRATGDFIFAQGFPGAADRHARQPVLDVQHQQHHQEQHDVDKHKFQVRVVSDAEEFMNRHPAVLRASAKLQAKKVGDGTGMPFGPPVNDSQLLSTSRMISPNPSVTMAR
jgi:hypothetical protein